MRGKTDADSDQLQHQWHTLVGLAQVLGIEAIADSTTVANDGPSDDEISDLIEQRLAAKKAKDFALADQIRDDLTAEGITLIDKPGGITDWHR